ncbi:MAG: hypothetical protein VB133_09820 [Anaeromusa sp.]|uniref:hypothetical protein n=1 Tax=Anaeromusa sp. TaxID=1872520 RepID=UPI002B1F55A6|nr:hypothetical protein [Anaeromusa sp.]MEA4835422.1 hypothetical protein [Anaeromusa sp.]
MLTQQELLENLKDMGTPVTSQTLRTREKQGLVTPAYRGKSGKPGRSVFYPDRCLYEHYAAGKMLGSSRLRLTAEQVKSARDEIVKFIENPTADFLDRPEEELLDFRLGEYWISWYALAVVLNGCLPEEPFAAEIVFRDESDGEIVHIVQASTDNVTDVLLNEYFHCIYTFEVLSNEFLKTGAIGFKAKAIGDGFSGFYSLPKFGRVFLDVGIVGYFQ